jgi:hypothetical protein
MSETVTNFRSLNCEAAYKVVRAEAPPTHDNPVLCLSCGAPVRNREGDFVLKYFRNGGSRKMKGRKPKLSLTPRIAVAASLSIRTYKARAFWNISIPNRKSRARKIKASLAYFALFAGFFWRSIDWLAEVS